MNRLTCHIHNFMVTTFYCKFFIWCASLPGLPWVGFPGCLLGNADIWALLWLLVFCTNCTLRLWQVHFEWNPGYLGCSCTSALLEFIPDLKLWWKLSLKGSGFLKIGILHAFNRQACLKHTSTPRFGTIFHCDILGPPQCWICFRT